MERFDGVERSREKLDLRLREALEPRPEAVERVVSGALAASRPAPASRSAPVIAVLATLLAVATLSVLVLRPQGAVVSPEEPQRASISIENVGDLLVVRSHEGGRLLIHNGKSSGSSSPSGSIFVVHGGRR